ncbi:hypothetical protein BJV78DRAFT_350188 [Lactifluus subvellereus]|nr:hypothetical protein BJV78DRAFT_350188 [Lactifluus subvellereus]
MLKPLIYCNVLCLLSCAIISQCFKLVRDPQFKGSIVIQDLKHRQLCIVHQQQPVGNILNGMLTSGCLRERLEESRHVRTRRHT